jgi:glutathione S-transferase
LHDAAVVDARGVDARKSLGEVFMIEVTHSPTSPFVRKVRIVSAMKGLDDKVAFLDPEKDKERCDKLRAANPLQKIPAARLEDGALVFDSHVICEYFDTLSPTPRLFPAGGLERLHTLTLGALADGIMDASILVVYEGRFRTPETWHQPWVDKQQEKIDTSIAFLESNVPDWTGHPDYGHVSLACALGFLDLRLGGKWRKSAPKLSAWLDRFAAAVPAFAKTTPPS